MTTLRSRGVRALVALLLLAAGACRTTTAPPGTPGVLVKASLVAAAPSRGCRSGDLPALVGAAREVTVGGEVRRYLIDAPPGAADVARPLVLVFHGFGHSAAGLRAGVGFLEHAATGDLIAIHADGRDDVSLLNRVGRGWDIAPDATRDAAFATALLDAVESERCVDRRRVFATGFSNGGFFASLLACRLADRLAAVAAVAGSRPLDTCQPTGPIPILFFHGSADQVVPPRLTAAAAAWWRRANHCSDAEEVRDGCQAAQGCAADVVVCTGPQAHTWPRDATERIWEFFRRHPRSDG